MSGRYEMRKRTGANSGKAARTQKKGRDVYVIDDDETSETTELSDDEDQRGDGVFEDINVAQVPLDQIKSEIIRFQPSDGMKEMTFKRDDLKCLNNQSYMNDVVIEFYLRYIKDRLVTNKRVANKTYIFSTFFFEKMLTIKRNPQTDNHYLDELYKSVRNWTEHVDVFAYDFLIVPIFKDKHWSLAIICYPGKLLTEEIEIDSKERCCIVFFDSIDKIKNLSQYARLLRNFLEKELDDKKSICKMISPELLQTINPPTPRQQNDNDCGLFLLHYVELFLKNPDIIFENSRLSKIRLLDWFDPSTLVTKRVDIFYAALEIHKENLRDRNGVPNEEDIEVDHDFDEEENGINLIADFSRQKVTPSEPTRARQPRKMFARVPKDQASQLSANISNSFLISRPSTSTESTSSGGSTTKPTIVKLPSVSHIANHVSSLPSPYSPEITEFKLESARLKRRLESDDEDDIETMMQNEYLNKNFNLEPKKNPRRLDLLSTDIEAVLNTNRSPKLDQPITFEYYPFEDNDFSNLQTDDEDEE